MIIVNDISLDVNEKLSEEDRKEMEEEFESEVRLEGASYNKEGKIMTYKYRLDHYLLRDFRLKIREWLINHCIYDSYFHVSSYISIDSIEKLSSELLNEFEEDFEVKLKNYSLSCGGAKYSYKFG